MIPSHTLFKAETLGADSFRKDYNVRYAYYSGSMYKGVSSPELVIRMGKSGFMGFLGTGGLTIEKTESAIRNIQHALSNGEAYGMNLLHQPGMPQAELALVDLYLKYEVKAVEASAFMQITPALVKFRLKGLTKTPRGIIQTKYKLIAKISRSEIAEMFLRPAPMHIIKKLLNENQITIQEAEFSQRVPMADDLCVEADSGGHTDGGVASVILPTIIRLRDRLSNELGYTFNVRVGAAGGIGTPEAAAAAFILGADFIVTGSINQCTVEAGTSDQTKNMLQEMKIQDTDYAPAGDMFEVGARVQVLKRGVFFPARANKLYDLWKQYNSLDEIDEKTRNQIESKFFQRSFEEVYEETRAYYEKIMPSEIRKAETHPRHKMALIFRWYFIYSSRIALQGNSKLKVDAQIHTGPAMGAFNEWVKDSELENWKNRHVDQIARKIMTEAAEILNRSVPVITHMSP